MTFCVEKFVRINIDSGDCKFQCQVDKMGKGRNKMKKFLAVILAVVMSTGFCVNAFAIESSSLHGIKNILHIWRKQQPNSNC